MLSHHRKSVAKKNPGRAVQREGLVGKRGETIDLGEGLRRPRNQRKEKKSVTSATVPPQSEPGRKKRGRHPRKDREKKRGPHIQYRTKTQSGRGKRESLRREGGPTGRSRSGGGKELTITKRGKNFELNRGDWAWKGKGV